MPDLSLSNFLVKFEARDSLLSFLSPLVLVAELGEFGRLFDHTKYLFLCLLDIPKLGFGQFLILNRFSFRRNLYIDSFLEFRIVQVSVALDNALDRSQLHRVDFLKVI